MNILRRTLSLSLLTAALAATGLAHANDIETRTIKFPSASNKGHPQVMGVEKFAELVAAKTGGKFTVKPFPGGTLGPDLQTVSAMQGGTMEMTVMNASLLAGNAKEMAIFDFPFLFSNTREADAVADGPVGKKLLDKLQERGLVGLAYWDLGFRQIHTTKKPIARADDFNGMKMRVIPTPLYVDFMKSLGASPVPMPFTETYTALEQGAIDGMTNPLLNILDGKYNEVSKHLTITNHMYTPQAVIVSKKFWDKLSPVEQKIMRDAAQETAVYQRKVARDEAAKVLAELKKRGMNVIELPPEEIAKLRERSKPVLEKYTKELGPIVQEMYAAVDKARAAK
ncbi:tripartite ATP-independent transporter DctP family solute receptor [Sphaerotilus hippei]|uniref:Tripartite ATP-independent transporter DctP family solute receptor n=1 Tax=Sphaerotilus hippei TaxID=744406 RepID=A0A318HFL6_9BURK|nr:TRAP transporter substrate-binding protein [Sphaerotilus hippei]PXW98699.1 tripartite ATP-independent transporter DctP family solute receptor [Sphaerotilus hippei]